MKNLTTLVSILLFLCFVACGSDDVEPTPPPTPDPTPEQPTPDPDPTPEKPQGVTTFVVGSIPDSVKVETSTDVKFSVNQKEYKGKFAVSVDTVMPFYYKQMGYNDNGDQIFNDKRTGNADILLNGQPLSSLDSLTPGVENTLSFSNPSAVGEYKIVLNVTDKFKRTKKQEIRINVFSPKVVIKFYDYFPGFDEENYFSMLNGKYTYNPLSSDLKGIRVDTIYTREEPVHGRPGEWTVPGQGIVCYIGQEGNNDFQFFTAQSDLARNTLKKPLTNTHFSSRVDGVTYWELDDIFKPGFHGIMFQTSTSTVVGSQYYTLRVVDKWGKEAMATIVYKAFGRNESIPAHATPSDDSGSWWGHRIAD